jgi:hypothetical protein
MLALDPYYEMFPTSYRRSYPWYRYSWGETAPNTSSGRPGVAIGVGIGVIALSLGALFLARR